MPLPLDDIRHAIAHLERGDWREAHGIVQKDEKSTLACWLHGIVHLMEGDEANARYWYQAAKRPFPARPDAAVEIAAARTQIGL